MITEAIFEIALEALLLCGVMVFVAYFQVRTERALAQAHKTGKETQALVNSAFLAVLKKHAEALRRIWVLSSRAEDLQAAEAAEAECREHATTQDVIDRQK